MQVRRTSDQALIQHGVGHFDEAGDVGAHLQVTGHAVSFGGFPGLAVDGDHDVVQPLVDLFAGPLQAQAVLRHLQTGDSHAAALAALAGP